MCCACCSAGRDGSERAGRRRPLRASCSRRSAARASRSTTRRCANASLASMRRSYHPAGTAAPDDRHRGRCAPRRRAAADQRRRTLVLHGKDDPLVPFACGQDTARRIPGAGSSASRAWATTCRPAWSSACSSRWCRICKQAEVAMNTPEQSQLGKPAPYVDQYDASLLFPISRLPKRAELGLHGAVPFFGADLWTAFELSWLTPRGKPQVAIAHVTVPCETPNIVESKSFKLYLNSFTNTRFRLRRRGARAHPRRRERGRVARRAGASVGGRAHPAARPVRPRAGARTRRPEPGPARHRVHAVHARAGAAHGRVRRAAGGGSADQQPAQEQLPGHRPARLGQRADPLQRAADRPGRAAALPRELSQPQRVPRAVRGAHLHGHLDALQAGQARRCTRATRAAAGWTSTRSAPAIRWRCRRTSARRGSRASSCTTCAANDP